MNLRDEIIDLEKAFWTGGEKFYKEHLARDVIMVFPSPVGILQRDAIIAGLRAGARWESIATESVNVQQVAESLAILAYKARARRAGSTTDYITSIGSVYIREAGRWKLVFHQQTPETTTQPE